MKVKVLLFLILLPLTARLQDSAQPPAPVDSLHNVLKKATSDTTVINIYHQLYTYTDSIGFAKMEMKLLNHITNPKWYAQALLDIGRWDYFYGDPDSAITYLKKSIQIAETHNYPDLLANAYRYMGFVFRPTDSYEAKAYYEKSLTMCRKIHNELLASYDYSAIGNIYESIQIGASYDSALGYYLKSFEIRKKLGNYEEKASSLLETSRIYGLLGYTKKSFMLRTEGLKLAEKAHDITNIVFLLNMLGCDYTGLFHNTGKGLAYEQRAYKLALTQPKNYEILMQLCRSIGLSYREASNFKKAGDYFLRGFTYMDSLNSKTNKETYNISGAKHTLEIELEKQKAKVVQAEILKQKAETGRQTMLRNTFIAGFGLLLVFAALLYYAYHLKNIANRQLALSNKKTEQAYKLVETKNKDITDSINYASTIQKTILVSPEKIAEKLKGIFIINQPKDIVSGDFYWEGESYGHDKGVSSESILIAACDCTGHGVPGALVSIFCSNALNKAVKEFNITEPGKILDKVRELVVESFSQRGPFGENSESNVQDGMDISLLAITPPQGGRGAEIHWAGANIPLWYIEDGKMKEIAPDKQSICKTDNPKPFTTHTIKFPPSGGGGALYLFTDGYADQFGGKEDKKFSKKRFYDLLQSIHNKPMAEQADILLKTHLDWKGNNQQVDDILVMGIRV